MHQSYNAFHGHFIGKQPSQWNAVHDPEGGMAQRPEGYLTTPYSTQHNVTAFPSPTSVASDFVYSLPTISSVEHRPHLPNPYHILKSQGSPRNCTVCGRSQCTLVSHKNYANEKNLDRRPRGGSDLAVQKTPLSGIRSPSRTGDGLVRYPVAMDAERQHLLNMWSQNWGSLQKGPERHMFPIHWIDVLLPAALNHAPLFEALLATSGSYLALATNPKGDAGRRHLQLAEQMLSQVDPATSTTDECILTSILITGVHLAQGKAFEVGRQFAVLAHIVAIRGGPHYLGISGMVAELLLHVDHCQAVFFDRLPTFKLPLPALDMGLRPELGQAFRDLLVTGQIDHDLLLAADALCRTTDVFRVLLTGKSTATGITKSFGYLSSISEYQLARCNMMLLGSNTWSECICLALLLYNNVVLRNHGFMDALTEKVEYRLWDCLDNTTARHGFQDIPPCLLLWVLITGLTPCIYTDCKYRRNAVEKMRAARISAAITGWDQFRSNILDAFLWLQSVQEELFREVWLEVEGVKAVVRSSGMLTSQKN